MANYNLQKQSRKKGDFYPTLLVERKVYLAPRQALSQCGYGHGKVRADHFVQTTVQL